MEIEKDVKVLGLTTIVNKLLGIEESLVFSGKTEKCTPWSNERKERHLYSRNAKFLKGRIVL